MAEVLDDPSAELPPTSSPESTSNESQGETATKAEQFDLLYGTVKDIYRGLIEFEFGQGALLAAALGWLLTSSRTQTVLVHSRDLRILAVAGVLLLTVLHGVWCVNWYRRARQAFANLRRSRYMPLDYLQPWRMRPYLPTSMVILHSAMSILICLVISRLPAILAQAPPGP